MTKKSFNIQNMVLSALFTALIAVGAFVKIPVPVVPFTLQLFFTMLAGLFLGPKWGSFSTLMYMVLGLIGLPIFAQGGGLNYIFQPSFGYIIGFVFGTYLTGYIANKVSHPSYKRLVVANFSGLLVVYAIGMFYYFIISNYVLKVGIGLWPLFLNCFLLLVPGDIVWCFVGAAIAKKLMPIVNKQG